ncbi:MAB_1171c family putative transporter [Umezawaea tangerina]|uniref:DUF6545 domain-containing protein n=1 Tax=Umezawaea tangerina TaxID=84725 RepID=A0A2T0T7E4_9PSEU|nr:MAB_1171c family putative transporter [Umezawaea tangerina]PRY41595.1 hypothetical protein CLV43_105353 [Umezawaea tangerina]
MILLDSTVIAAAAATAAWLYFLRALLRKPLNNTLLSAWLGALCLAFSLYLGLLVYGAEAAHPLPLWARSASIAQHVFATASLYFGYTAYVHLIHGREEAGRHVVRHARLLVAAVAVMLAAAVLADPDQFTAAHVARYGDSAFAGLYLAVFTAYAGLIVTATARVSWTWSRLVDDPWIRRGLLVGTAGLVAGVLYFLLRAAFIVLAVAGRPIATKEGAAIGWLLAISVPLSFAGLTTPGWGPRLASARTWWRTYHAHRRLHPLWAELTDAFPHVRMSLEPSRFSGYLRSRFRHLDWMAAALDRWDERWSPLHRHLDLRLHLRVMQIWDARRALLDRCDPADHDRALTSRAASTLSERHRAALAEAAMLTAGLARLRTGEPGGGYHAETHPLEADLFANVAWFLRVAKYMKRGVVLSDEHSTSR